MEAVVIEKGDYINGEKITEISYDPFRKGVINIFVDKCKDIGFGDKVQVVYRLNLVKESEKEND